MSGGSTVEGGENRGTLDAISQAQRESVEEPLPGGDVEPELTVHAELEGAATVQLAVAGRAGGGGTADTRDPGDGEGGYYAVSWDGEEYSPDGSQRVEIATGEYDDHGNWAVPTSHEYTAAGEHRIRVFYSGLEEGAVVNSE